MSFYQEAPELHNPFLNDEILISYLKRFFQDQYLEIKEELTLFGERVVKEMEPLALEAESHPPVHVPYDPWGKRIDKIEVSSAWNTLHDIAAEEGIVSAGYYRKYKDLSRLYQFAKLYLYHPSSALYSCPLAMTDGAARVLELFGDKDLRERVLPKLISRKPEEFWTSGQWMTEKTGGSDVSGTSTTAFPDGDNFKLHGVKWFTSATTSEMAMTLAKINGDDKLSLFYVELRNKNNELQNIQINRLKEKLGTRALPTAELTLDGTPAKLVGERGKGVKTISYLFNITRMYNSCCAIGYMRRGISLSIDYSKKRKAFGKKIFEHSLHIETLSDLQVRFEASFLMTFHSARLLGKEETGTSDEIESATLRLLTPLTKLYTAKESVSVSSEVIESFGGAGYVEDTGIPQILRNAQVLTIWEGTTNILALDVIRAIKKEDAYLFFVQDIERRMNLVTTSDLEEFKKEIKQSLSKTTLWLQNVRDDDLQTEARNLAMNLSRVYCASLLVEHADWSLKTEKDERYLLVCRRYLKQKLFSEFQINEAHRKDSYTILTSAFGN